MLLECKWDVMLQFIAVEVSGADLTHTNHTYFWSAIIQLRFTQTHIQSTPSKMHHRLVHLQGRLPFTLLLTLTLELYCTWVVCTNRYSRPSQFQLRDASPKGEARKNRTLVWMSHLWQPYDLLKFVKEQAEVSRRSHPASLGGETNQ